MRNPARVLLPTSPAELGYEAGRGFQSIVADPPWSFRDKGSRIAPDQRKKRWGRKGYRTMSLKEILDMGLEVKRVAAQDAFLFLWTTSAHLLDGSAVLLCREWGFEPKTTIAWVKAKPMVRFEGDRLVQVVCRIDQWPRLQIGMGHYVRGSHQPGAGSARPGQGTQPGGAVGGLRAPREALREAAGGLRHGRAARRRATPRALRQVVTTRVDDVGRRGRIHESVHKVIHSLFTCSIRVLSQ